NPHVPIGFGQQTTNRGDEAVNAARWSGFILWADYARSEAGSDIATPAVGQLARAPNPYDPRTPAFERRSGLGTPHQRVHSSPAGPRRTISITPVAASRSTVSASLLPRNLPSSNSSITVFSTTSLFGNAGMI